MLGCGIREDDLGDGSAVAKIETIITPVTRRNPSTPSTIIAVMSRESEGSDPALELPISQFVEAAKKNFQDIIAGGRYVQTVSVTLVIVQT